MALLQISKYLLKIPTPQRSVKIRHLDCVLASQHIFDLLQVQGDLSWYECVQHKLRHQNQQQKHWQEQKTTSTTSFSWSSKYHRKHQQHYQNQIIYLIETIHKHFKTPQKWFGARLAPLVPWAQHAARWTWSRKYSAHCSRMADVDKTCERWDDTKMLQNIFLVWNWTVVVCFGGSIVLQCLAPSRKSQYFAPAPVRKVSTRYVGSGIIWRYLRLLTQISPGPKSDALYISPRLTYTTVHCPYLSRNHPFKDIP